MAVNPQTIRLRQFLIEMVKRHPSDLVAVTAKQFGTTRQAVHRHLKELCDSGVLRANGRTKSRTYELCVISEFRTELPLSGLEEDVPWLRDIKPRLQEVPQNVVEICSYGFTEMLNNAIDHSGGETVVVGLSQTAESVTLDVHDAGVGIFRKIQATLGLHDEREAILQLSKGKLTTDPERHTGEGVFFTSRMVDLFSIRSGTILFTHVRLERDWRIEEVGSETSGTAVRMTVSLRSSLRPKDLFDQYANPDELTFSKTHVPIRLAQSGSDNLVSRSQARRVLLRCERFSEVFLDFTGVEFIGQAFADEVFRVFQNTHPEITLLAIHANGDVAGMIHRARSVAKNP